MAACKRTTALILISLLALTAAAFLLRVKEEMVDFEVNYQAAQRLRQGETLYRASDGHYQFKYLPFSAFLYLPLSFLPLPAAKAVWYGIVLLSSFLIFYLTLKLLRPEPARMLILAVVPPLIMARYFLREVQLGQINAFITLLLLLMVWFLSRQELRFDQVEAGFFWGMAAALKPYAVIFLPYFILRRNWRSLAAGLAVLFAAFLAPSFFYGIRGNFQVFREWRESLAASTPSLFSSQDNVSLIGFLVKWTGRQSLSLTLYFIMIVVLSLATFYLLLKAKKKPKAVLLDCFLLLAFIPLISPLGWDYTFLSFAPAVVLILQHYDKYRPFWRAVLIADFVLIALTLYDLMGRHLYAAFMHGSAITGNFLILIAFLFYLRLKGHA